MCPAFLGVFQHPDITTGTPGQGLQFLAAKMNQKRPLQLCSVLSKNLFSIWTDGKIVLLLSCKLPLISSVNDIENSYLKILLGT